MSRANARMHDYAGVPVRVVDPEHLAAMALQTTRDRAELGRRLSALARRVAVDWRAG